MIESNVNSDLSIFLEQRYAFSSSPQFSSDG